MQPKTGDKNYFPLLFHLSYTPLLISKLTKRHFVEMRQRSIGIARFTGHRTIRVVHWTGAYLPVPRNILVNQSTGICHSFSCVSKTWNIDIRCISKACQSRTRKPKHLLISHECKRRMLPINNGTSSKVWSFFMRTLRLVMWIKCWWQMLNKSMEESLTKEKLKLEDESVCQRNNLIWCMWRKA